MCVRGSFISVFAVLGCVRFIVWAFYTGRRPLRHRKTKLSRRGVKICGRGFLKTLLFFIYNQLIDCLILYYILSLIFVHLYM